MEEERSRPSRDFLRLAGRAVLLTLRALPKPPEDLPDRLAEDPDGLAEILLDHADQLAPREFLQCLSDLLTPYFDRIAVAVCLRECWFLDPARLAEDAVARVFEQNLLGQRIRPFSAWAWRVLGEVTRLGVDDPALALFRPDDRNSPISRIRAELARRCNRLPFLRRRITWLAWVDNLPEHQIAARTGLAFEEVEHVITRLLDEAMTVVLKINFLEDDEHIGDEGWDDTDDREENGDDGHA